jgi:ribonuclease P protein component
VSVAGFCKSERIRSRADFVRLSAASKKTVTRNFVLLAACNDSKLCRIGITVSRKVGNAVCRNRLKRYIREFYRHNKEIFLPADFVVIARAGADRLKYSDLCQELVNAVQRVGKQLCS